MNYSKTFPQCLLVSMLILLLTDCASTQNDALQLAQNEYGQLQSDTQVVHYAPVAVAETNDALNELKQQIDDGEDDEIVQNSAYVVKLKAQIAREEARAAIAKEVIAKAETERERTIVDVRTKEAEQARQKAQSLEQELSDLKAKSTDRGMVLTLGDVLFDFKKSNIKAAGLSVISKLADFMQEHPERNISIEGHTDNIGSEQYNLDLSDKRAEAVKRALMYKGISADRMTTAGYGKEYPVASNASASGRQQNRRVEIVFSDTNGVVTRR